LTVSPPQRLLPVMTEERPEFQALNDALFECLLKHLEVDAAQIEEWRRTRCEKRGPSVVMYCKHDKFQDVMWALANMVVQLLLLEPDPPAGAAGFVEDLFGRLQMQYPLKRITMSADESRRQ